MSIPLELLCNRVFVMNLPNVREEMKLTSIALIGRGLRIEKERHLIPSGNLRHEQKYLSSLSDFYLIYSDDWT
jgi:hypothetical protein